MEQAKRLGGSTFARWKVHGAKIRDELGMPANACPWTTRADVNFGGYQMTERQRNLLDCAWGARRRQLPDTVSTEDMLKGWWCNVTQSVQRKPWSATPPTPCRQTRAYSFEHDVVVTGFAHMMFLGWPRIFASNSEFSSQDLHDLSGEAFSVPIAALFSHAFFL